MTLLERCVDRNFLRRQMRQLFLDSRHLLLGAPLSLAAFAIAVAGFALGAGLAVVVAGVPIVAATLSSCRVFAGLERKRIELVLHRSFSTPVHRQAPADAGPLRRWWVPLTDPRCWLDLAHAVVRPVLALPAFCIALTWWTGALVGLASPVHFRPRPIQVDSVGTLLIGGESPGSPWFDFAVGAVLLLTLVPVVRAMAWVDSSVSRVLLRAVACEA
jgi:hypothetical protein